MQDKRKESTKFLQPCEYVYPAGISYPEISSLLIISFQNVKSAKSGICLLSLKRIIEEIKTIDSLNPEILWIGNDSKVVS